MYDPEVVWRNGRLVPFADATCHVMSHMAARGSQVFDVLAVTWTESGPCAVGLRPHVARFLRSAEMMGMDEVGELGALERAVAQTVLANCSPIGPNAEHQGSFLVKIIAGWVEQANGLLPAELKPTVYIVATPSGVEGPIVALKPPTTVRSADMPKIPAEILPPSLKVAASYTPGLREQMRSRSMGFDNTAFKTVDGDLAESTTLSMLVVSGDRILAPPLDNVLDGITRRVLLDAAQADGVTVDIRAIRWDEVRSADELLLSSTNQPVTPVSLLDDVSLTAPGPITEALGATVSEILAGTHGLSAKWLTPLQGLT